jgi:hypothetical protein
MWGYRLDVLTDSGGAESLAGSGTMVIFGIVLLAGSVLVVLIAGDLLGRV